MGDAWAARTCNNNQPLRVGVVGAGRFGERHAIRYCELPSVVLSVVCDIKANNARKLARRFRASWSTDYREIADSVDCVSIVTPLATHYEIAKYFLNRGVHVLVEKPMCGALEHADTLIRMADRNGLVLYVGHVERFNPTVRALFQYLDKPQRIEARRLSRQWDSDRSSNVVLDLMIHDLDLILQAMGSMVRSIEVDHTRSSTGAGELVHARLGFDDGSLASVVAGHGVERTERTMRVFQGRGDMEADLCNGTLTLRAPTNGCDADISHLKRFVTYRYGAGESLLAQIKSFVSSIEEGSSCLRSANLARQALKIAMTISEMIEAGSHRTEHKAVAAGIEM
jgi:predicted dehydrogenase